MNIKLNNEYIEEVFEILCSLPFEKTSIEDSEPRTTRHPGIEQIIDQICPRDEEGY